MGGRGGAFLGKHCSTFAQILRSHCAPRLCILPNKQVWITAGGMPQDEPMCWAPRPNVCYQQPLMGYYCQNALVAIGQCITQLPW